MYYGKSGYEWAHQLGRPYATVVREFKRGWCKWPRRARDGSSADPAYKCWENMVQRATNSKATGAHLYSGRGVTIAPEWIHDFKAFLAHIGPRPSLRHSIDRIDPDGHYVPGNVRWSTYREQAANKRARQRSGAVYRHGLKWRVYASGRTHTFPTEEAAHVFVVQLQLEGHW